MKKEYTLQEMTFIASVAGKIDAGTYSPIEVNKAYELVKDNDMQVPMGIKTKRITWFMTFNYNQTLDEINAKLKSIDKKVDKSDAFQNESKSLSQGNPNDYSHQEEFDIQEFITEEEKKILKSNKAGTEFITEKAKRGRKKSE